MNKQSPVITKIMEDKRYKLIDVSENIGSVVDCINLAKRMDTMINNSHKFLVLYFHEKIIVTGSFMGFLVERIRRLKELRGDMAIITPNQTVLELLKGTSVDKLVQVIPVSLAKTGDK